MLNTSRLIHPLLVLATTACLAAPAFANAPDHATRHGLQPSKRPALDGGTPTTSSVRPGPRPNATSQPKPRPR